MQSTFKRSALTALAMATALTFAAPALAEMANFKADLKGSNEVPPNDTKGSGSVTVTFDTASKKMSWKGSFSGTTGPAAAAHFHVAEKGKNGGVAVPITGAEDGSFEGSATLTDAQASDLMAGKFYVNIHTAAHKPGELRGQVEK